LRCCCGKRQQQGKNLQLPLGPLIVPS
jgi:hypothetical protein